MFNCNHFLVSQTNPHIVPLLNLKKALSRKWANVLEAELKHRCQVAQWLLPEWVPSKWLMLFTQVRRAAGARLRWWGGVGAAFGGDRGGGVGSRGRRDLRGVVHSHGRPNIGSLHHHSVRHPNTKPTNARMAAAPAPSQAWEGDITMTLPSALWHLSKTIVNPTTEELIRNVKVGEVATWEKISAIECNCSIEATLDKCLANIANQVGRQRGGGAQVGEEGKGRLVCVCLCVRVRAGTAGSDAAVEQMRARCNPDIPPRPPTPTPRLHPRPCTPPLPSRSAATGCSACTTASPPGCTCRRWACPP